MTALERWTAAWWRDVLSAAGVRLTTAVVWSTALASHLNPRVFSKGESEIPDFMGQALHETGMLERMEENLDYSADRLMQVWPKRFPDRATAERYARNPEKLAGYVYGYRLGNTSPADGWAYRGRGIPQITGKANYMAVQRVTGIPVGSHPEMLSEPSVVLDCAVAWWEGHVPDSAIGDPEKVTEAVNGGQHGLANRERLTGLMRRLCAQGA